MTTIRTIIKMTALTAVIAMFAIVGLASAGNAADPTTPHYTDGTEDYTGVVFPEPFGDLGPAGFGPIGAPHFEGEGDDLRVCIDPPFWIWVTLHTDINGVESPDHTQVFPYEHNTPGFVCVPYTMPVCPDDTEDLNVVIYGTWNIGSGAGPSITETIDCTPEEPVVPPVVPPVVTPPVVPVEPIPPVELAPPVVITGGTLPATGSDTQLALLGVALIAAGVALARSARTTRTIQP